MPSRGSTPGGKRRKERQAVKERYARAREDAQLAGVIPVTTEGAVRSEVVNPSTQAEQDIPSLDRQAVVKGWAVPDEVKQKVIERLSEPFFEGERTVLDKNGNPITLPPDRHLLKENAKVLVIADQRQYERDNPEAAGKAKGQSAATQVNVGVQVILKQDLRQILEGVRQHEQRAAALDKLSGGDGAEGSDVASSPVLRQAAGDNPKHV